LQNRIIFHRGADPDSEKAANVAPA
jgi:hypothetical protein